MFGYSRNRNLDGGIPQQNSKMDINDFIQQAAQAQKRGVDPNAIMAQMIQKNPNIRILQQRVENMAQGRTPQEFIMQLARQNGATDQSAQMLAQMFNHR